MDVRRWLSGLGFEQYADAFVHNDIDDSVLGELTEHDLVDLGVSSLGHRKRIMAAIRAKGSLATAGKAVRPATVSLDPVMPPDPARSMTGKLERALADRGYVITGTLGEGGMGSVLLARQERVGRNVAVKVLRGAGTDLEIRFEREARAIAALTHPNSVRLYDFLGTDGGEACILLEHVDGESLAALLSRDGRLAWRRALSLVAMVSDALTEAHAKGIVHRDLKPANILLQSAHGYVDFPRVVDFGLARFMTADESRLTSAGGVYGTPRYLSPEQIEGTDVTLQSDLYSLGVILYEMLAGRPPFTADGHAALFYQHLREPPPPLPAQAQRPAGVDGLIERLMAKSPALRPPSAHAVRRELSVLIGSDAVSLSIPPSSRTRAVVDVAPERRQIVVLDVEMCDAGAVARTDEATHSLLGRCRAVAGTVRRRHGGHRAAMSGTRETWVFGAPIAHRDDLRRALDAALDLVDALRGVEGAAPRVGVAAGAAVSGATQWGRDPFVIGEPLDIAARLRDSARAEEVLVESGLVGGGDVAEASRIGGAVRLRATSPSETSGARSMELPFVGRARELGELEAALARCRKTSTGRVVVLAGEAGIGKSRLLDRFLPTAKDAGFRVARALIHDADVAPEEDVTRQLVAELLELPGDKAARSGVVEEELAQSVNLRPSHWPFLFHFLGVPLSRPMQRVYDALEPPARRAGYRDMLASVLASLSKKAPLVLVIEDVHWADDLTLDTVESLCAIGAGLPVVLVLTSRVEGEERWRHCLVGQTVTRLELGLLNPDEADALARRLGATRDHLTNAVGRAGGHPLLLTELVRSSGSGRDALPPSIPALVHARLDRLPERDRAAVQVAAVLGLHPTLTELRDALGDPEYDPTTLMDYRLFQRSDDQCTFIHALVRDAVYESIVEERRRSLHERCASQSPDPGAAAMHLERAGSLRAAEAYMAASQLALQDDRYEEARHLARHAADLASQDEVIAFLELQGQAELLMGEATAAERTFAKMAELAVDHAERYRALVGRADALRLGAGAEAALPVLDQAQQSAELAGIEPGRAFYLRGGAFFSLGRLEECRAAHERALESARRSGDVELVVRSSSGVADALYGTGRIVSALSAYEECVAQAEPAGLLGVEVSNLPMLGIVSVFMNDLERATEIAHRTIERARELSHHRAETLGYGAASLAALHRGDYAKSVEHARVALELTRRLGSVVYEQTAHYYIARAWLAAGELDRARVHADKGLQLCREHSMSFVGAALLATQARVAGDGRRRADLLREGEEVLRQPSLSFNRLWFAENAIEDALSRADAADVRKHAQALAKFIEPEPFPWAQHLVARAQALADALDGDADPTALADAVAVAKAAQLGLTLPALEQALAATRSAPKPAG